jgi:hypothetical protein
MSDLFWISGSRADSKAGENVYQTRHRSDQTNQGRDADDDFQDDNALLQPNHLMPRARLHRLNIFRAWPTQMRQRHPNNSRQRRRILMDQTKESFRTCARREPFHLALNGEGQNIFLPQRQCPENYYGERNNRADQQRPHKNAALGKKPDDRLNYVEHY